MSFDLKVERLMDCTPDEAFDAFVQPEAMKDWYQLKPGWTVELVTADLRAGGTTSIEFGNADEGWRCREDITFRELDRPHRVVYDLAFTNVGASSYNTVVTATFEDQDGKTLMTLSETGYPNAEERDAHQNGWPGFLESIEQHIVAKRS